MVEAEQVPRWDLLEQFRRNTLRHLSDRSGSTEAGIYQFADATDDEKLLAFVGKFGPIWGRVVRIRSEGLFKPQTVTVQQKLTDVRRRQVRFAAAVSLMKQLNRNAKADPKEMVFAMMRIFPVPEVFMPDGPWGRRPQGAARVEVPKAIAELAVPTQPGTTTPSEECAWLFSMVAVHELTYGKVDGRNERIRGCGHRTLCQLFNEFPPILVPVDGQPIEMPRVATQGIAYALYFQLRLDYLAQRAFGTCQNCGGHFLILKRGARACGETCRRALRNQRYWNRNKKAINRRRRVVNHENR
jgi:hypothetical protein